MVKKRIKKAKTIVTDVVTEKAAVLNPLSPKAPESTVPESVPQITDKTIAKHREDVLGGARKFIYPLAHSKRRIISVTIMIIVATFIAFMIYCGLALYRFHQYNSFVYRVTQVIPFPIAREGGKFIDYENYLFELRHYVHYYESQLQRDFAGTDKQQLVEFRKQALQDSINAAYVKDLAKANDVSVSGREVDERITMVRNQNRLGSDRRVFNDVLRDYWGWSLGDFKRSLKQQILAEKVAAKLDTAANEQAKMVLAKLESGSKFDEMAKKYSKDERTRNEGGAYGFTVTKSNANVPPQVTAALLTLKPGKVSDIIVASPVLATSTPTLEIVKVDKRDGSGVTARHISIPLRDALFYVQKERQKHPAKQYVTF